MSVRSLLALAFASTILAPLDASASDLSVGGHGVFDVRYLRLFDDEVGRPYNGLIDTGMALRAMAGLVHVQLVIGLDFHLGGTHPAGFAYAAHFRPLGIGFSDGEGLRLSMTAGIGLDGVTEAVEAATRVPVDFLFELPLVDCVKLEVGGELAWLPIAEERQDGAPMIEIADEAALVVRVRVDRRYDEGEAANGYFLGLEAGERHKASRMGFIVGYGFDAAFR